MRGFTARSKYGALVAEKRAQDEAVKTFINSIERSGQGTRDVVVSLCEEVETTDSVLTKAGALSVIVIRRRVGRYSPPPVSKDATQNVAWLPMLAAAPGRANRSGSHQKAPVQA